MQGNEPRLTLVLLMSVMSLVAFLYSTYTYVHHLVHLVFFITTTVDRSGIINMPHGHAHTRAVKLDKMHMHKVQLGIWIKTTMGT